MEGYLTANRVYTEIFIGVFNENDETGRLLITQKSKKNREFIHMPLAFYGPYNKHNS